MRAEKRAKNGCVIAPHGMTKKTVLDWLVRLENELDQLQGDMAGQEAEFDNEWWGRVLDLKDQVSEAIEVLDPKGEIIPFEDDPRTRSCQPDEVDRLDI